MHGSLDLGLDGEQFGQAFRGAGRLRELAPYFAELPEPACGEDRVEDELPERARRGAARSNVLRADPTR